MQFLQQDSDNKYWDKLLEKYFISSISCKLYHCEKMVRKISSVNMLLGRIDTFFFFLIYKIGDWSLNNRFISRDFFNNWVFRLNRKQRFKVRTCPTNITLVLENMSDGHISILVNKKKIFYITDNIMDFPWNTCILEGKIVWCNHHHYPHIKAELNG